MTAHVESLAIRSLLRRPILTADRERHLLRTHRTAADVTLRRQAFSELWESHSRLVVAVASQYRRPGLAMTELVGAGHLGMHAAIEGYRPETASGRLSSYAVGWIRLYIQDYIRRHAVPGRVVAASARRQLQRAAARLFADARRSCRREGVQPHDDQLCARVAARAGVPREEVAQWLRLAREEREAAARLDASAGLDVPAHLDASIGLGAAGTSASGPDLDGPGAAILRLDEAKLRRQVLALAEEVLGERERVVFLARCVSLEEVVPDAPRLAARLGLTLERVQQLEASARRKMEVALTLGPRADPTPPPEPPRLRSHRRTASRVAEAPA
ncbi:MAG: sigma-70 family RNA polymerase sigma factor [Acetobacteraceae bacterium]